MNSFRKYPLLVAFVVIAAMVIAIAAYAASTNTPATGQGKACVKAAGCGSCPSATTKPASATNGKACCPKNSSDCKSCPKAGTAACKDCKACCKDCKCPEGKCAPGKCVKDCKCCCATGTDCKDCCKDGKCTKAQINAKTGVCKHCPKTSTAKVVKKAPVAVKK